MRVWLERVPLREASMSPTEILASESQERMLLIVAPEKLEQVLRVAEKWGVWATAIADAMSTVSTVRQCRGRRFWCEYTRAAHSGSVAGSAAYPGVM